ncbi:hypothetical protein [Thermoactinospora rubra]|uniref:hypothetical protein n=1 Tax=Thermoactinospora rubra TaxID=1088767 RepID=UPI000A0F6ADB|nr:hypothetical protein [Thermoactinospora rubra]
MRTLARRAAGLLVAAAMLGGVQTVAASAANAQNPGSAHAQSTGPVQPMGWVLYRVYPDGSDASRSRCHSDGRSLFGNQYKCSLGGGRWMLYFWS